jgi:dTDP-4-amino-4,6-dideoxygalactose transaminase
MTPLLREAEAAGIVILEDCAQSPAATYFGRPVGSMGAIATFSFQYNKSITCGEGGMVVTDDPLLYERAVRMSDLGLVRPFHAAIVPPTGPAFCGGNFRLTELQAAVALAQVRKLDSLTAHCRMLHRLIGSYLVDLPGITLRPSADPDGDQGFELYFRVPTPELADAFRARLDARNVTCQKVTGTYCHYARPYCQSGLAHHPDASPFRNEPVWPAPGYRPEDFPRTEDLVRRFVALPIGVLFTVEDARYIGECVRRVCRELMG